MRVVDSIQENGAKLVEISPDLVTDLQAEQPGLRIIPVVYYHPAKARRPSIAVALKPSAAKVSVKIDLTIVSQADGSPIPRARVLAFTDFASGTGIEALTNSKGVVGLSLGSATKKVERLYVYSEHSFWSILTKDITLKAGMTLQMSPIDYSHGDGLRHFYGNAPDDAGAGVTVGVIDTGVGPHDDLVVEGGENTVTGEAASDFGDNGEGHGTHVAGIIAAKGKLPMGVRGLAPGVKLRSYRVFGTNSEDATNFALTKAIERAVADGCDLINMSLGGGPKDEAVHSAIADARGKGSLIIVASGNDGRKPVSFPAADSLAIAVSALGREGTFPNGTAETAEIVPPSGRDAKNFIAEFSNVGPEIDLTAPGVGIISTFPGNHYAVMSGTSMACPAVTGAAARLLAATPDILGAARKQERSDAIAQLVLAAARTLGFPGTLEGQGLIKV